MMSNPARDVPEAGCALAESSQKKRRPLVRVLDLTRWCLQANDLAIQVDGGFGCTCEPPIVPAMLDIIARGDRELGPHVDDRLLLGFDHPVAE